MKKEIIILSVVILVLAGAYYLNLNPSSEEEGLTEEEIIGIVEVELEEYCQYLLVAKESNSRGPVCSSREEYKISRKDSEIEISVLQRVVYGTSVNRGSSLLNITLDNSGKIIKELR